MKKMLLLLIIGLTLLLTPHAHAAGQATPDEAKTMAIKAASTLKSSGPEKVFPEFDAKDSARHDRDRCVNVIDSKGIIVAHDTHPGLIVTFKWQNPVTNAIAPKIAYYIRVIDDLVGVGAYGK